MVGADPVQKEAKSNSKPEDENKSEGDGADQIQKEAKGNSEHKDDIKSEGDDADQVQKEEKINSKTDDKNKKLFLKNIFKIYIAWIGQIVFTA